MGLEVIIDLYWNLSIKTNPMESDVVVFTSRWSDNAGWFTAKLKPQLPWQYLNGPVGKSHCKYTPVSELEQFPQLCT